MQKKYMTIKIHDSYSSHNIVTIVIYKMLRLVGHVAWMGNK